MSARHTMIIGAGQAGGMVAATLRQLGPDGAITLIGDEAWPPYERPPLSKTLLQDGIVLEKIFLRPAACYAEQSIELVTGRRVLAIDRAQRRLQMDADATLTYDRLVIATGARARRLTIPGAEHPRVHVLRNLDDALRLRGALVPATRLLIVGGGFIGLEIAASARAIGAAVTVMEQATVLMGRVLPAAVSSHLRCMPRGALRFARVLRCVASGTIPAATSPRRALAKAAGLAVDGGVVVDELGRSDDPCNWAAGDVTWHLNPLLNRHVRLESRRNAQNQAIAVAKAIAGQPAPYAELPWLWTDQFDLNLQLAGLPSGGEQLVWRGAPSHGRFTVFGMVDQVMHYAISANRGREMRFAQQLIAGGKRIGLSQLGDAGVPLQRLIA